MASKKAPTAKAGVERIRRLMWGQVDQQSTWTGEFEIPRLLHDPSRAKRHLVFVAHSAPSEHHFAVLNDTDIWESHVSWTIAVGAHSQGAHLPARMANPAAWPAVTPGQRARTTLASATQVAEVRGAVEVAAIAAFGVTPEVSTVPEREDPEFGSHRVTAVVRIPEAADAGELAGRRARFFQEVGRQVPADVSANVRVLLEFDKA
ncbi:MAG TPA: hypothetical protein VF970_07275 [Gemmatimonadales bacterium]